ncbi:MAG: hypothetical protein LKF52_02025 [Butyrivibrio sp.]|jgi:hypothetical protein|nr:hypothetical protein [Butyrivibrio sp.]
MKYRKTFLFLIRAVLFLVILTGVLYCTAVVLQCKDSQYKYADFFRTADQLDVLFLGSSHVINGINPVQFYEDYGYTSYNMGGHGSVVPSTYWEFRNALDYCRPEYVVVDAYMLEKDFHYLDQGEDGEDANSSTDQLHLNMDCWPYSQTKVAAVKDLLSDKKLQRQFLYDFILYHNRWEELGQNDFLQLTGNEDRNILMGAEQRFKVDAVPDIEYPKDDTGMLTGQTQGELYLEKLLKDCRKEKIRVILTFLPKAQVTEEDVQSANSAGQIAEKYEVPFLNFLKKSDVVNFYTDMNDNGHLNSNGMQKVTEYIGQYLHEHTDLADHRGDTGYELWDQRVDEFQQSEAEQTQTQENLYSELMVLGNHSVNYVVYVKAGSEILKDPEAVGLLEELTGTKEIENAVQSGGPYFLAQDDTKGIMQEYTEPAEPDAFDTTAGKMEYIGLPDFGAVYLNGDEDHNLLDMGDNYGSDLQILIMDRKNGQVLKHQCWYAQGQDYQLCEDDVAQGQNR